MQHLIRESKFSHALVQQNICVIYRIFSSLIISLRSQIAKEACKTIRDVFQTVQCAVKPVSMRQLNPLESMRFIIVIIQVRVTIKSKRAA
jgi:hypothetical protein